MLDFLTVKEWWTSFVAGPDVLFYIRMCNAGAGFIYAALCWWDVVRPVQSRLDLSRRDRVIWGVLRFLLALGVTGIAAYYLSAGFLERDRSGTPVRLLIGNSMYALIFWVLILISLKRRVESWARAALRGELR